MFFIDRNFIWFDIKVHNTKFTPKDLWNNEILLQMLIILFNMNGIHSWNVFMKITSF